MIQNDLAVCFDSVDSLELGISDHYFHLMFWLKVNTAVFEASVLEYDRYEPHLGPRRSQRSVEL